MAASAGPRLTPQDKKDLDKFTKFLIYKSVQIIVQSRLGYKVKTQSKPFSSGSDWFNLAIRDIPEVLSETKRALSGQLINTKQTMCVEISLKTADGDTMVLELWSLSMVDQVDLNTKVSYMVYNRMGILLKSLFCISRVTPAYRLSRAQGPDNYVVCYRIFLGDAHTNHLGEGCVTKKVGGVPTPIGKIILDVAYRTKLLISPQTSKDFSSEMKENHFMQESPKKMSPAKPCSFAGYYDQRRSSLGDLSDGRMSHPQESQDGSSVQLFCTTPPDRILRTSLSPHNRKTSAPPTYPYYQSKTLPGRLRKVREDRAMSLSRSPDRLGNFTQNFKTGAFAPARTPDEMKPFSDDVPFAGLYRPPSRDRMTDQSPVKRSSRRQDDYDVASSNTSSVSNNDDFVMVELKTPFAERDGGPSDLGKFYRDCQGAPSLAMFDNQPSVEQTMEEITEQIAVFDAHVDEFDDFIDNLEVEH